MIYLMEPSLLREFLVAKNAEPRSAVSRPRMSTGKILVEGVLVQSEVDADYYRSWGISSTSYEAISKELRASSGPVEFHVNSGGGESAGCDELMKEIRARGNSTAIVHGMAASAAYGIASQCDEILCTSEADLVGSIGVAIDAWVSDRVVSISSTDAPKKRPDLKTEEGKAAVREMLDQIHELFVEQIAIGRGCTVEKINTNYGRGGVLTARNALKNGMVDGYVSIQKSEEKSMDLQTLKAEHPALFAEIVNGERDRVKAHIDLGKSSGDLELALKNIVEGAGFDGPVQAAYLAANMRRGAVEARVKEDPQVTPKTVSEDDFWDGVK